MKKYFVFLLLCLASIYGTYAQKIKPNFKLVGENGVGKTTILGTVVKRIKLYNELIANVI